MMFRNRKTLKLFLTLVVVAASVVTAQLSLPAAAPKASAASFCPSGDLSISAANTVSPPANGLSVSGIMDLKGIACVKPGDAANAKLDSVSFSLTCSGSFRCPNTAVFLVLQAGAAKVSSDTLNSVDTTGKQVASSKIAAAYPTSGAFVAMWIDGTDPTDPAQGSNILRIDISASQIAAAQKKGGTLDEGTNTQQGKIDSKTGTGDPNATCETGGFGLNWIICPVFNATADFCDWLFQNVVQPFLATSPISTNPNDSSFQVWSQFRVYGNVFLIIGLLVLVFGQSIGGGLIDAYTVKKSLPRILIAAILINLSIYIVAGLVDITNVLGGTLGNVMTAPLKGAGAFKFSPSGVQAGSIIGITGAGAITAALSGVIGALLDVSIGKFILLFLVMPVVFGLLAAFVTLVLRKGIILALILVSPVAFALYCLPNTEKYFRKWWDFLLQTLLVYPLVIVIFSVADILSVTVMKANGKDNVLAPIIAFTLQFLPLLMIPYAFRLAGGAVGKLHETLTNYHKRGQEAIKGNPNDPYSARNMARRGAGNAILSGRERAVNRYTAQQKRQGGPRRGLRAAGIAIGGRAAGFGNYQVRRSLRNKEAGDLVQSQTGFGDDSTVRAGFARELNYRYTDKDGRQQQGRGYFGSGVMADANGFAVGQNKPQYSPFEVNKARQLQGRDPSLYQAALTYEIGKAGDDAELGNVMAAHHQAVQSTPQLQGFGGGIWKGAAFGHVQSRRELKHTNYDESTGEYTRDAPKFTREVAENVNNWSLGNMRTSTVKALREDHGAAQAALDLSDAAQGGQVDQARLAAAQQLDASGALKGFKTKDNAGNEVFDTTKAKDVRDNVVLTANALDARQRGGESFALAGEEGSQSPIGGAQTGAAGRVDEQIQGLINDVKANRPPARPAGPPPSGGGGRGPAPRRPQPGSGSSPGPTRVMNAAGFTLWSDGSRLPEGQDHPGTGS